MNSTGLNILINILTKSRNAGGETVIANIPEKVKQLMIMLFVSVRLFILSNILAKLMLDDQSAIY